MTVVVGRCRGVEPRAKVSMMTIWPPQHGQGRRDHRLAICRITVSMLNLRLWPGEELAGARDIVDTARPGEQAEVADAV
jgi:hypothetical protein